MALKSAATSIPRVGVPLHEPAKLRIAIVTENIMPQVDGVTRCLARLLSHLKEEGHSVVVLGPQNGMSSYETYPLIGTAGIPLVLYPGLKLNFLRPLFLRTICEFVCPVSHDNFHIPLIRRFPGITQKPDVIHVVDPIWLGAQVLIAIENGWCGSEWARKGSPIVASYHTNLPTYAPLFGLHWLEPVMWRLLRFLHGKCLLTACPSNSTAQMLQGRGFSNTRLWPRGVDLDVFTPARRSRRIRQTYGVVCPEIELETNLKPQHPPIAYPALSPPTSLPDYGNVYSSDNSVVILNVGRISYEKNLVLLVHAFSLLLGRIPPEKPKPRLVFVGDGPARHRVELLAQRKGVDAIFVGHVGDPVRLAEYYASADIFAFPSFTETFGQVICEALASGLPVIGLDAPGTRDLVVDGRTGFLLPKPAASGTSEWNAILPDFSSGAFEQAAVDYSHLLGRLVFDMSLRLSMSKRAVEEGAAERSWSHAMDAMVACYREGIAISRERQAMTSDASATPRSSIRLPQYILFILFVVILSSCATYWVVYHF